MKDSVTQVRQVPVQTGYLWKVTFKHLRCYSLMSLPGKHTVGSQHSLGPMSLAVCAW